MHTQFTRSTVWDSWVLYSIVSGDILTMCVCVCVGGGGGGGGGAMCLYC